MKLMDDVAGIVAARHCKTNIVTASVDAINFHDKIKKGERPLPRTRGGGGLRRPGPPAAFAVGSHPAVPRPWRLPVCHEKREAGASCSVPRMRPHACGSLI